ncbi:hypothetical protein ABOM_002804 [Aspergillus bombycis]|uniref:DUF6536 domain-containing protein n=1 Tax=Aspergillus bombycis TaxID=109264 RepID=A0A1F8A900_9EURO|nr:hypothetical protein ABOM_002804 [Aspergillus bombycis]OGM48153.1 hypothetical protein ABOM_002804 [Aspergillus bombycis]
MHDTEESSDRASIDNDGTSLSESNEKARKSQTGYEWRNGASLCLYAAAAILFLNILLTIIAASRAQQSSRSFEAETILEGSCAKAKRWSTGFHILINVLGTILLGASNYCMQCLSAPSRRDVDRVHAHGKWLDIGTPSVTNLRVMSWMQIIIWCLLVLTSLPFHVLYNAAVFSALSSNAYGVVAVPPDGRIGSANSTTGACYKGLMGKDVGQVQMMYQEKELEFLSKEDCIKAYGVAFLSNRRTLLLVTNNNSVSSPGLFVGIGSPPAPVNENQDPFDWMCSGPGSDLHGDFGSGTTQCLQSALLKHVNDWSVSAEPFSYNDIVVTGTDFAFTGWNYSDLRYSSLPPFMLLDIMALGAFLRLQAPSNTVNDTLGFIQSQSWKNPSFESQLNVYMSDSVCATYSRTLPVLSSQNYPVDYCLSEKVEERCRVMYSAAICLLVIVCNAIKVVCILFTIRLRRKELFFTVGDAIASFMKYPDRTTLGRCWVDQKKAKSVFAKPGPVESRMLPPRGRWHHAVGRRRWTLSVTWCLVCLACGAIVTAIAYTGVVEYLPNASISTVWSLGFSETRPETMIRYLTTYNLVAMVVLSNTPQVILSSLYYLVNSILTCMLASAEYTSYSVRRQYLRVSWPEGQQRSTYFLSLPYAFSIPTMAISATLHWLLSESIFYVRIYQYDPVGILDETETISTCGISPIAMIFTLSLAGLALAILAGLGFKRFPAQMPLAGNCSLAISAACHPPLDGEDAALRPLMWGEVVISGAPVNQGGVIPGEESREEPGEEGRLEEEVFRDNVELEERSLLPLMEGQGASIFHCCFTSREVEEPVSMRLYV